MIGVEPNGPLHAYATLGYDLYVLKHNLILQHEVVNRLKRTAEFHGARYELLVAATFVRSGFDIKYEDETDNTRRHPEFIATHKRTGIEVDVEAKKRNRLKKLTPEEFNSGTAKIAVRDRLADAIGKFRGRPYIICLDLDVPPICGNPYEQPWFSELRNTLDDAGVRNQHSQETWPT